MAQVFQNIPIKIYIIGAIIFAGILFVQDGFYVVPAGHVGVIYDMGRGVLPESQGEGLKFKMPIWQHVDLYSVRTREYTMSIASNEGKVKGDDSIQARSKDGQIVYIDATVLFNISPADAPKIKQTLGSQDDYDAIVVRPLARASIREIVANYNVLDLVSEKREEIVGNMNKSLAEQFIKKGVTLSEVVLRNVTFSAEFSRIIEEKQMAAENVKIEGFKKEQAVVEKERKIIQAEAEAEAIALRGESLRKYPEIIQLEFVQKMGDDIKWGILPSSAVPMINMDGFTQ